MGNDCTKNTERGTGGPQLSAAQPASSVCVGNSTIVWCKLKSNEMKKKRANPNFAINQI